MKKSIITLALSILFLTTFSENLKRTEEVLIEKIRTENQKIEFDKQTLGKYTVEKVSTKNQKSKLYKIKILSTEGILVADYDVDIINKKKKKECAIVGAYLKTMKDKVSHHSANFIDFNGEESEETLKNESEITQLNRVVKYLIEHKYL